MKQLKCEMCGGTDFIKQDGMFVCQSCGLKYTPEEAKKVMVEGTVDVKGTVKVDNSNLIETNLKLAQNADDSNNYKDAENYANIVLQYNPANVLANKIKAKNAAMQTTGADNRFPESLIYYSEAIKNIDEDKKEEFINKCIEEINEIFDMVIIHVCNIFINYPSEDSANTIIRYIDESFTAIENFEKKHKKQVLNEKQFNNLIKNLYQTSNNAFINIHNEYTSSEEIDQKPSKMDFEKFVTNTPNVMMVIDKTIEVSKKGKIEKDIIIALFKLADKICNEILDAKSYKYKPEVGFLGGINENWEIEFTLSEEYIQIYNKKKQDYKTQANNYVNVYNEKLQVEEREIVDDSVKEEEPSGGCYVATCVYGSYDCPEVWTLRRYRDNTLASTWYGRAFIHLYYAVSPTIVKYFGETTWFKKMWKGTLDKMVSKLQSEGVESTPYEDKKW